MGNGSRVARHIRCCRNMVADWSIFALLVIEDELSEAWCSTDLTRYDEPLVVAFLVKTSGRLARTLLTGLADW